MSENQDHVMSEPEQPIGITFNATGCHLSDDAQPPLADGKETKKRIKTRHELVQDIILKHAMYKPSSRLSKDATDEEKQADRQRWLNKKSTRWRQIISQWPRDPKGEYISDENSPSGKMAPNGIQIWGATLFDLYHVRRAPEAMSFMTLSSGSKLAAWMKENGEYYAKGMLDFAENEADPQLITPYKITGLIIAGDMSVREKSWVRDGKDADKRKGKKKKGKGKNKGKGKENVGKGAEREDWQVPQPWPPASTFDARAYPKPWPIEPFTELPNGPCPKLQAYITHSHLPKILKVHDPWNLLCASHIPGWKEEKNEQWSEKTDIVHTYKLETSTKNTARRTQDDEALEADEANKKAIYDKFIADPHTRNKSPPGFAIREEADDRQPGPVKPLIFVVLPFQPPIPPGQEAHLYLSPNESIGQGNHSFVYSAEFELPRSTIMDDIICKQCIMDDMLHTLEEQDGPNGERRDPKWDEKVGRYIIKKAGKPPLVVSLDRAGDIPGEDEYYFEPCTLQYTLEYEGPYRLIYSKIGHQCLERGPYCEHIARSSQGVHPLTARVKVAAKLSVENDNHLSNEAEMYQAFPRHFFEHWSGFNIIKPIKEPIPVGPLVPQFYGYYVPDADEPSDMDDSQSESPAPRQYLSPILLIEDCGKPLDPKKLTLDDQSEAASLVFRFHEAGWIHGSVAKRNILIQPGPLSDSPRTRWINSHTRNGHGVDWSFRLIDFGRSFEINGLPAPERSKLITTEGTTIEKWLFHHDNLY